jgi:RNA polymerase sigma factor (sigma-70 family)
MWEQGRALMDEAKRALLNHDMAALARGEREAFDAVYRVLWPLLVKFIAAASGDGAVAEDMAQLALLKIFTRVATFDATQDALAWSMTIAINEYRSHRRKMNNQLADWNDGPLAALVAEDNPETTAIRENLSNAVKEAVGKLRSQDQETLIAAFYEGPRPHLTGAAFRKRLQRALANLRAIWKGRYGNDRIIQ